MTIIQTSEAIREADRYSDKYGLTTVLLVLVIILLLVAVWKVILPLFKEAQAKYDLAMSSRIEQDQVRTREFLATIKTIEASHKEEFQILMNTLKEEQRKNKR